MKKFSISFFLALLFVFLFSSCADIITQDTVASYVDDKRHFKILFHDDGSYEFNPISMKAPAFYINGFYEGDPRTDGTIQRYNWNILKQKVYQEPFEVKDGKFTTIIKRDVRDENSNTVTKEYEYVFIRKYSRKD